jgi:chitodextrinase
MKLPRLPLALIVVISAAAFAVSANDAAANLTAQESTSSPGFAERANLAAACRKGKTYITFQEDTPVGAVTLGYRIYHSVNPISDVGGLSPIADIPQGSGYSPIFKRNHIIVDLGPPLPDGTGLFVNTPHKSGASYYAVTIVRDGVEEKRIAPGLNSLAEAVTEEYRTWPGAVLMYKYPNIFYYFYWMDYSEWNHSVLNYGNAFSVTLPSDANAAAKTPLTVLLHGRQTVAPTSGPYSTSLPGQAVLVLMDPVLPQTNENSWWFGYPDKFDNAGHNRAQAGDTVVPYTENRVLNYLHAALADSRLSLDPERVYITGSSMGGSGALLIASHHPGLFAAIRPDIPMVDYKNWGDTNPPKALTTYYYGSAEPGLKMSNGEDSYNWIDCSWVVEHRRGSDIAPAIITHGSKDMFRMDMTAKYYLAARDARHGVFGQWFDMGHSDVHRNDDVIPGGYLRFRLNELYPALSNSTRDDNFGTTVKNSPFDAAGVMNAYVDWASSLHSLGLPNETIVDAPERIQITFKSSRSGTVVDVTPRRAQNFVILPGLSYAWQNVDVSSGQIAASGSAHADADGVLTVERFAISDTGSRLLILAAADDRSPPSTPNNLSGAATSSTSVALAWSASTDNVGVTGYRIYRNGSQVGTATATTFTDTGRTLGTTYSYTVAAFDAAGNTSPASSPISMVAHDETYTAFAAWVAGNFTAAEQADATISGPNADPDGCGLTNLARYAFGLPARGRVASPVALTVSGTGSNQHLTLTFPRKGYAPGLSYTVQSSTDLVTWTDLQTIPPGYPKTFTFTDSAVISSAPRRFLRVRITAP